MTGEEVYWFGERKLPPIFHGAKYKSEILNTFLSSQGIQNNMVMLVFWNIETNAHSKYYPRPPHEGTVHQTLY